MIETLFIIAWFIAAFFIIFALYKIFVNQANNYFNTPIEGVKHLINSAQKSFFVNRVAVCNNNDNQFNKLFNAFKTFNVNIPFAFKLYLLPDCIVLTAFNKYATVFNRKDCQFSKKGFFSYFTIIKDDKNYTIDIGFNNKLIHEWLDNK